MHTSLILSLRKGGGGDGVVATPPPFSDFPLCRFCVFAKIAIRSIYSAFVQIPMYLWKKSSKIFAMKKVGVVWGVATTPRPEMEGVAAKINKFL